MLSGCDEFRKTSFTELFLGRIPGFDYAVGVEHAAVASGDGPFRRRISRFGKQAQHQAVLLDFLNLAPGGRSQKQRRVPCGGVTHKVLFQVHKEISRRDKVFLKFAAKRGVQPGQQAGRVMRVSQLAGKGDLEHGGNQRGRNAVSGDVSYQKAHAPLIDFEEVVEVACYSSHRRVAGGNFEASPFGHALWKDGRLNPAGDFQLFVDGKQPLLVGKDAVGCDIGQGGDKGEKSDELDARSPNHSETHKICVDDEDQPNHKTGNKDAHLAGGT